ncbi:MAG TPA: TlpA disulfide reductase family protein [Mucilaginibacter sp.]
MGYLNNRFIRLFACIALVLSGIGANAQVSLIKNAINKLESCKNFSYQYVEKTQDFTTDTTVKLHKDIFQKTPGNVPSGYLFRLETQETDNKYHTISLYNGQNLINIFPEDSTYDVGDIKKEGIPFSALHEYLKWLSGRPEKKPAVIAGDTSVNGALCYHLIFDIYDTVINKNHCYTLEHVFINKQTGLPDRIISREKLSDFGNGITNMYTEYLYSNYRFDQDNVDIASMKIPDGFHLPKKQVLLPLLTPGTKAPDWTLYTTDGKQISMAQLKGKVVLLDFFFIGCGNCMTSLKSLDKIYEKYKGQKFVLISVSNRDSKKAVMGFKKVNHIKNLVCGDGADVAKAYHLERFPTFYYIDKEGKVANVTLGYYDTFEANTTSIIDSLLSK